MFLEEVIIENFRSYVGEHRLKVRDLTALIGKNDAGKSTIFDALAIFFEHDLGVIDNLDFPVSVDPENNEIRIGCIFSDLPNSIIIDENAETSLKNEYLLNKDGKLEIYKTYPYGKAPKAKICILAMHPTAEWCKDLLNKTITQLKDIAKTRGVIDQVDDLRVNYKIRKAIWESGKDLKPEQIEVQLNKEDGKKIWEKLSQELPQYALFRSDRTSDDGDAEVQNPLKDAIREAAIESEPHLNKIKEQIKEKAEEVGNRTLKELSTFDPNLASKLKPDFKSEPKWENIFKLLFTGEDGIPINKRGSGVRRLILFSFFKAEAERLYTESKKGNIIYAIEEPETSQHPNNQRKIIEALLEISKVNGYQVMLTTHVPAIASLLPVESVKYIESDESSEYKILEPTVIGSDTIVNRIALELGIYPSENAQFTKLMICLEGENDIQFLGKINKIFIDDGCNIVSLEGNPKVTLYPMTGANLKQAIDRNYFANAGILEFHLYDRDMPGKNGKYKYEEYVKKVNDRNNGDFACLTEKREMENYFHIDAISKALRSASLSQINITIDDNCDIPDLVHKAITERSLKISDVKRLLNDKAVEYMTIDMLKERQGYEEVKSWFKKITEMVDKI